MEPQHDKTASENDLIVRLKLAEEALRTRELNFQLVVDSIPAPVAVTSPSGEVEGVNQPTLEYFGETFEELKGWKASDVVHPDDLQHTIDALMNTHETGQAYTTKDDGMGIGLSVSRSIIASHRGRLWATPNEGPGATFSFSIPFAPDV